MRASALLPEWRRLDLLCRLLARARQGDGPSPIDAAALAALQRAVLAARRRQPWRTFAESLRLDGLDRDLAVLALAPEVEPRIGRQLQQLQGVGLHASVALAQELLGTTVAEAGDFHARLEPGAPLRRGGLVTLDGVGIERRLHATTRLRRGLMGWEALAPLIPGALRIEALASMDDLVLPPACRRALETLRLWVTERRTVVDDWGARPTGGPVALFAGPSGTGKTMAAEALASSLGWPLYRVDTGLLVSKYIGDTEKNLNALFDAAHGEDVVLLFDEADALFGRRGEVRDAHDRYANMEVGHLLARLERHTGPCVLTTNLRAALDPAFTRRFQVVVEFPRPDASARARLWQRHLPRRAPGAEALDCTFLGASVELTGAQIRNAALQAAYLAAGERGALDLPRLARGVWDELGKSGRERLPSGLGALAVHLPQGVGA